MTTSGTQPWKSALLAVGVLVVLSVVAIEPPVRSDAASSASSGPGSGPAPIESGRSEPGEPVAVTRAGGKTDPGATTATAPDGSRPGAQPGQPIGQGRPGLACKAGQNGGKTDRGVTGDRIKLAATNVRSGNGASFLGTAYIGMQAAVNRINGAGGVCGRLIDLRLVDDGWEAARGATFLKNFTREEYFALPVVPSSEGLTQAILNKTISGAGIPVVGSDGMLKEQYSDDWVWPVATSTVSTMRIMAKHAKDRGAKSFGIIFDQQYKFGREGASAYKQYVKQLTGADPKAFVGITPGQPNYAPDAKRFNSECGDDGCDFVAMLLDPSTANTYIQSQGEKDGRRQGFGRLLTGGAQPLFNERFARDCGKPCDQMLVWTGYNPPIGQLGSLPDVAQYVSDVRSVSPGVDVNNQFLEGAYLGMRVFLEGLQKVGPDLTRARLRKTLNELDYTTDISSRLSWRSSRFANVAAQPFRIITSSGNFSGFAEGGSGFLSDPTPGVVPAG